MAAGHRLTLTTLVVADYDEAIAFFVDRLGFVLAEDTKLECGKRWVVVRPDAEGGGLLLAQASTSGQRAAIGRQAGGRVAFFLETEDFAGDHARMAARGVVFLAAPRDEPYGTVAVFEDCAGNKWDLIEPK